jgi:hypothetical protein
MKRTLISLLAALSIGCAHKITPNQHKEYAANMFQRFEGFKDESTAGFEGNDAVLIQKLFGEDELVQDDGRFYRKRGTTLTDATVARFNEKIGDNPFFYLPVSERRKGTRSEGTANGPPTNNPLDYSTLTKNIKNEEGLLHNLGDGRELRSQETHLFLTEKEVRRFAKNRTYPTGYIKVESVDGIFQVTEYTSAFPLEMNTIRVYNLTGVQRMQTETSANETIADLIGDGNFNTSSGEREELFDSITEDGYWARISDCSFADSNDSLTRTLLSSIRFMQSRGSGSDNQVIHLNQRQLEPLSLCGDVAVGPSYSSVHIAGQGTYLHLTPAGEIDSVRTDSGKVIYE